MSRRRFRDRHEAGRALGARLCGRPRPAGGRLVLGLPRGGVPVAFEVAAALDAPLDVLVVRKLGVPGYPELAMGAVASGGLVVRNAHVLTELRIPEDVVAAVAAREREELRRRESAYRGSRPAPTLRGRSVVLVDDGMATGSTMRVAVAAVRGAAAGDLTVAVPAAPGELVADLEPEVDDLVCLDSPEPFVSVGSSYRDFTQVSDDAVRRLLGTARSAPGVGRDRPGGGPRPAGPEDSTGAGAGATH